MYRLYQKNVGNTDLIITVHQHKKLEVVSYDIYVYNINSMKVVNMVAKLLDGGDFSGRIGNVLAHFNKTGIYKKEIDLNLDYVTPNKVTGLHAKMIYPDWMVGTMDLETYKDSDNVSKPMLWVSTLRMMCILSILIKTWVPTVSSLNV